MQLRKEAWKKFRTSMGFEPVTSRYRYDALTNWAMKPLTLGAGQLWVHMFPFPFPFPQFIYDLFHIHHYHSSLSREHHRRHYFVTPKSMTLLYDSEFWIHLPHLVKEKIVFYTTVAKQREQMKLVCQELLSLPICPRFGYAMLTQEQLGEKSKSGFFFPLFSRWLQSVITPTVFFA